MSLALPPSHTHTLTTSISHHSATPDFSKRITNDSFLVFIYYILHNYKKLTKLHKIYEHLNDGTIKSDSILINYLLKHDMTNFEFYKKKLLEDFFNFSKVLSIALIKQSGLKKNLTVFSWNNQQRKFIF